MIIGKLDSEFGPDAKNNIEHVNQKSIDGAIAALETFYYSFNNKDAAVMKKVWHHKSIIQLNNPVGGIVRGIRPVMDVYDRIFNGQASVRVKFTDIVCYATGEMVVFAGTEIGEFSTHGEVIPLQIRTSRIFGYIEDDQRWFQLHHHGSIDNSDLLYRYQNAVKK